MPCYITFLHVSEKVTAKQLLKSTAKVTSFLCTGFQRLKDWCSALWTPPHPHLHFPLGAVGFLGWEGLAETSSPRHFILVALAHFGLVRYSLWEGDGRKGAEMTLLHPGLISDLMLQLHAASPAVRSLPGGVLSSKPHPGSRGSTVLPSHQSCIIIWQRMKGSGWENVFDSFTQWWWHQQRWFNCSSTYFSEWFPTRTVKCIIHPMEDCPFPLKGSYYAADAWGHCSVIGACFMNGIWGYRCQLYKDNSLQSLSPSRTWTAGVCWNFKTFFGVSRGVQGEGRCLRIQNLVLQSLALWSKANFFVFLFILSTGVADKWPTSQFNISAFRNVQFCSCHRWFHHSSN